jgi:microsomal dipeptidase-like Zn-dependent dipeptidase
MTPEKSFFADLHVHSSMKPFHHEPKKSLWEEIKLPENPSPCDKLPVATGSVVEEIQGFSKACLDQCKNSRTRILFIAAGPPDRPFFRLRWLIRTLINLFQRERGINLGVCLTGFSRGSIKYLMHAANKKEGVDYFADLQKDYEHIRQESSDNKPQSEFHLAKNFDHVKTILEADNHSIIGILSMEGAHELGTYDTFNDFIRKKDNRYVDIPGSEKYIRYLKQFKDNIAAIKAWGHGKHTPLFINVSHHFWNGLVGHARTFSGLMRVFGLKQKFGINRGFTKLGKEVLELLLSRSNGRRILIDVKHMSWRSRQELYRNYREKTNVGDPFPIVCSHTAISGKRTLADFQKRLTKGSEMKKDYKENYFNTWSVNLCDEDISMIVESDGIMGIILHEDRLPGGIPKEEIRELRKKFRKHQISKTELDTRLKKIFLMCIMTNIFRIIHARKEKSTWDHIGMGSDFDGIINHMEGYQTVEQYPDLREDILNFLKTPVVNPHTNPPFTLDYYQELMFDLSREEIVNKLFYGNVLRFLEKYYHDGYLLGDRPFV